MAKQINLDSKEFCLKLLLSETENEVIEKLKEYNVWDDRSLWKPYGDIQNNRSIVGNQQSSAVAALVEKIINSIDAILMAECDRHGVDPKSSKAPQSMSDAFQHSRLSPHITMQILLPCRLDQRQSILRSPHDMIEESPIRHDDLLW